MTRQDRKELRELVHSEIQPLVMELERLVELHGIKPETESFKRQLGVESKVEDFWRRADRKRKRRN